jgi:hypothetical protein
MGTLGTGKHTPYPGSPDGTIEGAIQALDVLTEQLRDKEQPSLSPQDLLSLSPADFVARVAAQLCMPPEEPSRAMAKILPFPAPRTPQLHGVARCLSCQHTWEAVTPAGVIAALPCPACGLDHGVLQGQCDPEGGTRWVCACGCDLFYVLPSQGCQCLMCGVLQQGF